MYPEARGPRRLAGLNRDLAEWFPVNGVPGNFARITSAGAFSDNGGTAASEAFGAGAVFGANNNCTVVGNGSSATNANCTLIGQNTSSSGNEGVAIGVAAAVTGTAGIAIGYGSAVALANTCVIGASGTSTGFISALYFGITAAAPQNVSINACGGSGSNIAGASITIAGGKNTGTGAAGAIIFSQSLPIATTTSSTLNALATVGQFDGVYGGLTLTQPIAPTGSPTAFMITGAAHTTLTLSTEATDVNFNLARTVQFATGAIATQRAFRVQAPTYGFVGASTITTAVTLDVSGPPIVGSNATFTSAIALRVGGLTQINGNLQLGTAGNKLLIATGSNASAGTGTLSSGTVTISTTAVTASSLIFLTDTSSGINIGTLSVGTITAATSFVVNSSNVADASTFNWIIIN
jgi:hypothetical protein